MKRQHGNGSLGRATAALLASGALAVLASCGSAAILRPAAPAEDPLARLARLLAGSFSSAAQAKESSDYFDIRLHMTPIWAARPDGPWLYVEQARADALERPYRQRVYHLSRREGSRGPEYISAVFELPGDPLVFAGAWKEPARLDSIAPTDLAAREGCEVVLAESEGGFVGSTVGQKCGSTLRGASYATSEVHVTSEGIVSWDRGFDAAGKQVWGAERGGYVFVRE